MPVPYFPPELIFDILVRLPPKDLIRCISVSKAWYAIIHDRRFIKSHLRLSIKTNSGRTILFGSCDYSSDAAPPSRFFSTPFNDDDTVEGTPVQIQQPLKRPDVAYSRMLGYSVDGIVCIHDNDDGDIALWNPSIQRLKRIPFPTFDQEKLRHTPFGFGYDSVNDDYKVVGIGVLESGDCFQVKVYSLKSNTWKRIQNVPCENFGFESGEMVFLNGALSWLMYNYTDESSYIIVTLDLASEEYVEFPTPVDGDEDSAIVLTVLGGCLCVCVRRYDLFSFKILDHDVWIMKEYGVPESWTQLYSISQGPAVPWGFEYCQSWVFSKNGKMVLLKRGYDCWNLIKKDCCDSLFWFDLEKKSGERVEFHGLPCEFDATICAGSVCLLDGDPVVVGRQQQLPCTSNFKQLRVSPAGSQSN